MVGQVNKWMEVFDLTIADRVHVFFDDFWITLNDWAVVVVRRFAIFNLFVNDTRVENGIHFALD